LQVAARTVGYDKIEYPYLTILLAHNLRSVSVYTAFVTHILNLIIAGLADGKGGEHEMVIWGAVALHYIKFVFPSAGNHVILISKAVL
jgi:hypothetical protein